jgi:signal peptidase II
MKKKTVGFAMLLTFAANVLLDRLTKALALAHLRDRETIRVLGDLFLLKFIENDGAFLSMGSAWNLVVKYATLIVLPLAVCVGALVYCALKERDAIRLISIVSIVAGGVSNLWDRVFNGFRVIDFMNFGIGPLRTGILNVADLSITFGAIVLILRELYLSRLAKRSINS